ncbi:MAG: UDP-glucose/GDP-mannose dehydrogenase family protein [Proteobacteria bacterium]|nr:UDP-glucose/GDP-mannose dehydrogenase family protein [Pseudomonadota bacterium]
MAKIAVVGTGYVGLTAGACLASIGHDVVCADVDVEKIAQLSKGKVTIFEDGLQKLVSNGLKTRNLKFVVGAVGAVRSAEFIFLCLPASESSDGSVDISIIEKVAKEISSYLLPKSVIVNKSTLPVGSIQVLENCIQREDVHVVNNPEFLREGSAVNDFLHPDRIVIGSNNAFAAQRVAQIYAPISKKTLITDPTSAETIKFAANAFLAARLSFVNALASVCEVVGANISDVIEGVGSDSRIGTQFLQPGPGWGGSCFPKDTKALLKIAKDNGYDFELLAGVISANESQFNRTAARIITEAKAASVRPAVAIWGLTFKSGTDDLRESPSLKIISRLLNSGVAVQAYDPTQVDVKSKNSQVKNFETAIAACKDAHVLAVLTEWSEFAEIDPKLVAAQMINLSVFDGRNMLNENLWKNAGFTYKGIGR